MKLWSYLAVALGCFVGANCRHLTEKFLEQFISNSMAILFINVLGCFIIGILTAWILLHIMHPHLVSFLVTGFCGGFTTFSSMVFYLVKPLSEGAYLTVLTYLCLNVVCGITAVYLGSMLLLHSREQYSKI